MWEHLIVRQLLYHTLTLPDTKRCPWWTKYSCKVPKWSSNSCEQGCFDRSISALSQTLQSKDVWTRASVLPTSLTWAGMSKLRHQYSIQAELLILLSYKSWMVPDMVPSRTVHHRFLILRSHSNLIRHLICKYKDKGAWRHKPTIYVIHTEDIVFEINKGGLLS